MRDPLDSDVGPHDVAGHTCTECEPYADGGAECDPVTIRDATADYFADRARDHALRGPVTVTIRASADLGSFADAAAYLNRPSTGEPVPLSHLFPHLRPDDDLRSDFTD